MDINIIELNFKNFKEFQKALHKRKYQTRLIYKSKKCKINLEKILIDRDIEVIKINVEGNVKKTFKNNYIEKETIEIGYCFGGNLTVESKLTHGKKIINTNNAFVCRMKKNDIDENIELNNSKCIIVSFGCEFIRYLVSNEFSRSIEFEWEEYIDSIFQKEIFKVLNLTEMEQNMINNITNIDIKKISDFILYKSEVLNFLYLIMDKCENKKNDMVVKDTESIVNNAILWINKNISLEFTLKDVSKFCNCSIYKLQDSFKKEKNMTAYNFIKKQRVEKAKEYLRDTEQSILSISHKVGYENPSKFAEVFKNIEGLSPTEYRKKF